MVASATFWDSRAEKYDGNFSIVRESESARNRRLTKLLGGKKRILDYGCANGGISIAIAEHVGEVIGVDTSPKMIKFAQSHLANLGTKNVSFKVVNEPHGGKYNKPFDAILALSVLHLVPDPQATLEWMYNQLEPGGYLVTETPCLGEMSILRQILIGFAAGIGIAPKIHRMTRQKIDGHFSASGFKPIESRVIHETDRLYWCVGKRAPR